MHFRIADTFTSRLARLTGDEQKAVKTTAFDLQLNPISAGMGFHKLDRAKDKNFWSVRVSSDIRLIVHKTDESLLLCYVDHHDKAYDWAERRKLQTHPNTGAAQLVELRETIQEVIVPSYVPASATTAPIVPPLARFSDDDLLKYGVPLDWLVDLKAADEDRLLALAEHLPAEAAEAIIELATGGKPAPREPARQLINPFDHPDARRRFRLVTSVEELRQALDYPWDRWMIFLHPDQRDFVTRDQSGPARVSGSAGTGKTVVALHRAVHLAREHPDTRVLLTTFSDRLAHDLDARLKRLVGSEPRLAERIDVHSINAIGLRLYRSLIGVPKIASADWIDEAIRNSSANAEPHKFSRQFLRSEWDDVVDAWQLETWEAYRDIARIGRKTRLPEAQRVLLWSIFDQVRHSLSAEGLVTYPMLFSKLAAAIRSTNRSPFDFAVIDEAQDIGIQHLRFFSALGGDRPNSLFFAGDLGQRIFQQPFSWKACGVNITGRSNTLRINYRMSHQIRMQADRLLGLEVADIDGNVEDRNDTVSAFNGPVPIVQTFKTNSDEAAGVAKWIMDRLNDGIRPEEIAVIVRTEEQVPRAERAIDRANGISPEAPGSTSINIATMHNAKGLEFRAVAVIACDDEVIPLQSRVEAVGDSVDLQEVYDTERHLLYVAATRAREYLLVTAVEPGSEFLDDLRAM